MIDPTLPECSPYLRRPVRDLLTALQAVATARKIGMIEAVRLVTPDRKPDMTWIDEAVEMPPEAWAAVAAYARGRAEPPKVVNIKDYRK